MHKICGNCKKDFKCLNKVEAECDWKYKFCSYSCFQEYTAKWEAVLNKVDPIKQDEPKVGVPIVPEVEVQTKPKKNKPEVTE